MRIPPRKRSNCQRPPGGGSRLPTVYPGTPSSEIIETLSRSKGDATVRVEWSVNEKVALEVAAGASWTGSRAAATMKHVGSECS